MISESHDSMQKKLISLGLIQTEAEIQYHNDLEDQLFLEKLQSFKTDKEKNEFLKDFSLLFDKKEKEAFDFIKTKKDNYYRILLADSYLYVKKGEEDMKR